MDVVASEAVGDASSTKISTAAAGETENPLRIRAVRCDRPATHFVYLMYDNNDESVQTTSIEISSNPPQDVLMYKTGRKKHRKSGKNSKCDWCLEQWIGPFNCLETAQQFQQIWTRSGRDLKTRIERGAQLGLSFGLAIFTMDKPKLEALVSALNSSK